jgi:hypothetical protein
MMRSLTGHRKGGDPILADIQRAFATGYHDRRTKGPPSKLERMSTNEIYAMISELPRRERLRVLDSLGRPIPGTSGRVQLL